MNSAALEVFCAVAEEQSITRAALRLGRAPSNVTTRIQQLEATLGAVLFLREGKRLRLSAQGERYLDYAKRVLTLLAEGRQALHPQQPQGTLRIGTMESTAASRLPALLARYHGQWPQVQLRLSSGPSLQLIDALAAMALDCAFVARRPGQSAAEASAELAARGLTGRAVFVEELLLLRPLAPASEAPALAAFAPGCVYRALALDCLDQEAVRGIDIQEVGSYHAMLACVAAGSCVGIMPRSVLELLPDSRGIAVHAVAQVETWLLWRCGAVVPALQVLCDVLAPPTLPPEH